MSKPISQYDKLTESLLLQLSSDASLTAMWLEDVIQPSIHLLSLRALIFELVDDLNTFEESRGLSDKTKQSRIRLDKMIEYCNKLDKIVSQNCHIQLSAKHISLSNSRLIQENEKLKSEIEASRKAFEQL